MRLNVNVAFYMIDLCRQDFIYKVFSRLVLANILAGPLISLARHLAGAVMPGGVVVLSGLLDNQSREVVAAYLMAGFRLRQKNVLAGWATLIVEREAGIVERKPASKRHQSRQLRGVNSWRARTL